VMSRTARALYRGLAAVAAVTGMMIAAGISGAAGAAAEPAGLAGAGSTLWARTFDGPAHGFDGVSGVAVSPDGGTVFVTGFSAATPDRLQPDWDYATVAYNAATGARRWASRYNGPGNNSDDTAAAVAVSPDGHTVFVTGRSATPGQASVYATVAYNAATGAQRWASRYTSGGDDFALAAAVSPDGGTVFVTGPSGTDADFDYATVAYNAATGARRWVSRYNGPGGADDVAAGVAVGPGGGTVFVTGSSVGSGDPGFHDYATVAYNAATGARRWVSRYDDRTHFEDVAHALAVSPDGRTVYVTGTSTGATSGYDYATVAYGAGTGAQRWVSRYNGRANRTDQAHALAVGPGGRTVYVTGSSRSLASGFDYATIAYNAATGKPRWVNRTDHTGIDNPRAVVAGPGGSTVYVTGHDGVDAPTNAYNTSTGAKRWASLYPKAAATAMAVSPDGSRVFIAGTSYAPPSAPNYLTVAIKA
jgi:DNA-binding beta-propeller fold protein YncE